MKRIAIFLALSIVCSAAVLAQNEPVKWVDFNVTARVMKRSSEIDIASYGTECRKDWIKIIAIMACENGNDFSRTDCSDVDAVADEYLEKSEKWENTKIYKYYYEAYSAALSGLLGKGTVYEKGADGNCETRDFYGICAAFPIAEGYGYSHYDDFGAARDFGYKRRHLGHDVMCGVGTPVVAVEGGYVETCGWNVYGGWRIGIRSFDSKRYYYYAHLRKGHPYCDIYTGKTVDAGEVIGYAGMTGYSSKEDVNNINVPHLHFGMELIFSPEQKDGYCQIWIDLYEISKFLEEYKAPVYRSDSTGEAVGARIITDSRSPD